MAADNAESDSGNGNLNDNEDEEKVKKGQSFSKKSMLCPPPLGVVLAFFNWRGSPFLRIKTIDSAGFVTKRSTGHCVLPYVSIWNGTNGAKAGGTLVCTTISTCNPFGCCQRSLLALHRSFERCNRLSDR